MPAAPGEATPAEIARLLARARHWFGTGDLARLVAELPTLLATAHEAADRHSDPGPYAQVAACYDLATETLNKIGRYQASRITADRATASASRSGSPIAIAAAARSLALVRAHGVTTTQLRALLATTPEVRQAIANLLAATAQAEAEPPNREHSQNDHHTAP